MNTPPFKEPSIPFPSGAIIYFRFHDTQSGKLASAILPRARNIIQDRFTYGDGIFVAVDENNIFLGSFFEDAIACILPLETVGPASSVNQPK